MNWECHSVIPSETGPQSKDQTLYVFLYLILRQVLIEQIAIENGVDYPDVLEYVREARRQGLKTPVLLMGMFLQKGVS